MDVHSGMSVKELCANFEMPSVESIVNSASNEKGVLRVNGDKLIGMPDAVVSPEIESDDANEIEVTLDFLHNAKKVLLTRNNE